ncbi:hypothetical protein GLW08_03820 [Pontibacillus yanchengensis]|uniref:Uncharacterized protein n=2 Tax=Pontibacillus yanchengensis TaxID=462910 RepID=A0ACC7VEU4_9BACI|nr:hypothetical protein [Pontibacillus yanchengensis]MYL35169.1 hypothetical protein [Pontibacillus yanchengensis]MYL52464.1 hypothetical protein [Pontibacillus yanchengensis]
MDTKRDTKQEKNTTKPTENQQKETANSNHKDESEINRVVNVYDPL